MVFGGRGRPAGCWVRRRAGSSVVRGYRVVSSTRREAMVLLLLMLVGVEAVGGRGSIRRLLLVGAQESRRVVRIVIVRGGHRVRRRRPQPRLSPVTPKSSPGPGGAAFCLGPHRVGRSETQCVTLSSRGVSVPRLGVYETIRQPDLPY
jgi:hypothetical protein